MEAANDKIVVSICCVTYNHESFIKNCLNGFVNQITNFDYEMLIHDDASTDKTQSIIKDYENKYPNKIRTIYQSENQWIKNGRNPLPNILFPMVRGKYIALCEGDDYWTDSFKLQKQVDFLETHPDYSICSHNVNVSVEDKEGNVLHQEEWLGKKHPETYTIRDLIKYGSGGATCSLVFRSKYIKDILDFFNKIDGGDLPLQIMCTQFGNMFYMREVMSVYRRNPSGICSTSSQVVIFDEFGVRKLNSINKYFKGKYQEETDYSLYHYFYPHLANAYYKNKNLFLYNLIRLKRFILKLQYRF